MNRVIKSGNGYDSSKYREIMIESDSALNDIDLKEVAPGSIAYNNDLTLLWMLGDDKVWREI